MIGLGLVWVIIVLSAPESIAIAHELKVTGTAYVAGFPEIGNAVQEDVVSMIQMKPNLGLLFR